jgi:hypothetical protein
VRVDRLLFPFSFPLFISTRHIRELEDGSKRAADLSSGTQEGEHKLTYLKGAILKYMLTEPEKAMQREALLRVIASILHFTPSESSQVAAVITEAAASAEDPVGTALASSWAGWAGVGTSLLGAYTNSATTAAAGTASTAAPPAAGNSSSGGSGAATSSALLSPTRTTSCGVPETS